MSSRSIKKLAIFSCLIALLFLLFRENIGLAESDINKDLKEAIIAYNNAEFTKAIKIYKKLISRGNIEGYLNLGVIYKDLGDYSKAIGILRARSRFGNEQRVLSLLGRLYYLNNQIDKAITVLKQMLPTSSNADTYITLGLCYEEKGLDLEAQRYYTQAIALDKNNVIARLSLAGLYSRKEMLSEALAEYKVIRELDPSIQDSYSHLADILLKMGDFKEALKAYQKLSLLEPEDKLVKLRIKGISNKLGKGYFEKERKRLLIQRKERRIFVKHTKPSRDIIPVRIGLVRGENLVEFQCSSAFEVMTKAENIKILSGNEREVYTLSKNKGSPIALITPNKETFFLNEPIIIKPLKAQATITLFNVKTGTDNFWVDKLDRSYRGIMEVNASREGINVINVLNLEEYLYNVLPSEMPSTWPKEALKAQAITARTEAMAKLGRHKNEGFDFCPEVHCQVYAGVEQESNLTNEAVDETRGIVMVYNGKPIDAVYSSNCGGHTQENIFSKTNIPYLKGKLDSLEAKGRDFPLSPLEFEYWLKEPPQEILCNISEDAKKSNFRWIRIYRADTLNEMLNKLADIGEIRRIVIKERRKSGHISAVEVVGNRSSYLIEKELAIRRAFGSLRSSMFKVEVKYGSDKRPKAFIFYGGGFGHGVGLCQTGALGMAKQGKHYEEILKHYFQEIELKRAN